jgi:hypothetical protein
MLRSVTDDEGDGSVGVGGHSGFLGLAIGLEMLGLLSARDEPRDDRDGVPFPLICSVSLDHEKAREGLVACAETLLAGVPGGVSSPMGVRASTSLCERLSLRTASFSSMSRDVSWAGGGGVTGAWRAEARKACLLTGLRCRFYARCSR